MSASEQTSASRGPGYYHVKYKSHDSWYIAYWDGLNWPYGLGGLICEIDERRIERGHPDTRIAELEAEIELLKKATNETTELGRLVESPSFNPELEDEVFSLQPDELSKAQERVKQAVEAFQEYANHRRDKGTANAKINSWNHLVFRMDTLKKSLKP